MQPEKKWWKLPLLSTGAAKMLLLRCAEKKASKYNISVLRCIVGGRGAQHAGKRQSVTEPFWRSFSHAVAAVAVNYN